MNNYIWKYSRLVTLIALVLTVALGVPKVNAVSGPPRSVFAQWPAEIPVPTLRVSTTRQADGRWQIEITATGFVFSDICTTVAGPEAVGHAHIYNGDTKITAAYSPIAMIGSLKPGVHRLSIVLRARDHRTLVGPSGIITAEITLVEPPQRSVGMAEVPAV